MAFAMFAFHLSIGVAFFCAAAISIIGALAALFEFREASSDASWPILVSRRETVERRYILVVVLAMAVFFSLFAAYAYGFEGDLSPPRASAVNAVIQAQTGRGE